MQLTLPAEINGLISVIPMQDIPRLPIQFLEINPVKVRGNVYEVCDEEDADVWTIYARSMEGDLLLPTAIIDCSTRQMADTLKGIIECLLINWTGPLPNAYSLF